ncbi:putative membrane protein [Cylindrospermum stagnale PCC 7417]|uniref:Putative membrane protein n=1 Tax=Cylindrospermum stagnale PCC 7417 TaxID=56107 RepID=K9WXQ8_9NOST|nr:phage holin family protein [Cylindrospermum stagnale]AFZ24571.1 putative membrane protein [Cylindrospermum stagnale PCC 7417]
MWVTFLTAIATALSLLIVDIVVPGVDIANFPAALIAALVIGLINGSVRPVLSALSLPLNFVSLGAFSLVVNGFCFWLASVLVPGFAVRGIIAFLAGPVILSFANTFINKYLAERHPALNSSGNINNQGELPSR